MKLGFPFPEAVANRQNRKINSLFFLSSGFPFFTDATNMSPTPASGSLLRCEPKPYGSITKSDLAPLLSAQFITAPVGRPSVRRNLLPEAPEPEHYDPADTQRIARRATGKRWFDRDSTNRLKELMSETMKMNDIRRTYRASTFWCVVLRMAGRSRRDWGQGFSHVVGVRNYTVLAGLAEAASSRIGDFTTSRFSGSSMINRLSSMLIYVNKPSASF